MGAFCFFGLTRQRASLWKKEALSIRASPQKKKCEHFLLYSAPTEGELTFSSSLRRKQNNKK